MSRTKPWIYIAGPFRAPTRLRVELHILAAEELGLRVAQWDGIPIIPHSLYRNFQGAVSDEWALTITQDLLRECDALALCTTYSRALVSQGTREELALARKMGFPVFCRPATHSLSREAFAALGELPDLHEIRQLPRWIKDWKGKP